MNEVRDRSGRPKSYWGLGYGWKYEEEFLQEVKKDVESYSRKNSLKMRTFILSEGRKNHYDLMSPYKCLTKKSNE